MAVKVDHRTDSSGAGFRASAADVATGFRLLLSPTILPPVAASIRSITPRPQQGWASATVDRFKDNIHITLWQADARKAAQVPEGSGAAFSFNKLINQYWLPFVRLGYSDSGGGAFLDRSLSAGFGYFQASRSDTFGFGVNWGRPSEKVYGPDADNQFTFEVFYRFQLFQHMTMTPDIQYLKNPVLYPGKTTVWIVGLRARLVF